MNTILDDFKNAWHKPNNGLIQVIIINVVVFVLSWFFLGFLKISGLSLVEAKDFIFKYIAIPALFEDFIFKPWTILTYAFFHSFSILHILFNMLWLYWFGRVFVDFLGSQKLINLYVLGALSGGLIYLLFYNLISAPEGPTVMIGASAAVYAVIVATATHWPNHSFHLFLIGPVKIVYIAVFAIFISYISVVEESNLGGNLAHLGGALVGFIYAKQLNKGVEIGTWVFKSMEFMKSFFVRKPKIKVSHRQKKSASSRSTRSSSSGSKSTNINQAEIDKILDKISEKGYDSLSKDEKEKLFNASKK